jgi:hypothetical protein
MMRDRRDCGGKLAGKRWRSNALSFGVAVDVCLEAVACGATIPALTQPVASGTSSYWNSITATQVGYV